MLLSRRDAVVVFFAFALAYFFAAVVRAITATLAPTLTQEFALTARELGLLAGGYFLGFASMQLPLGTWLDRHGPKKVVLVFLGVGALGCLAFAMAQSFHGVLAARFLCGMGLSACLMAPLTGFRRWLTPEAQMRANSWMLMSGSLGMVASTLPVQWLLPVAGWRPLFWGLAGLLLVAMSVIAAKVPAWAGPSQAAPSEGPGGGSYRQVWGSFHFRRLAPLGFVSYGGLVAMQALWIGPWLVRVSGYTPLESAAGLFTVNLGMLLSFWTWGVLYPRLAARGLHAERLIAWGMPCNFAVLVGIVFAGPAAGAWAWALFCVSSTCLSLAQPAVALRFPPGLAGRALSAFNLVIFAGAFCMQWGIGLLVDGFASLGFDDPGSFRAALASFAVASVGAWLYFMLAPDNSRQ
ncbi:MFS transporter [Ramlibacter sp. AW1]|uniref:MFS transporter n=1 Tax=Ramlibacter aurantiacus TaxID=2801330 RepID=A0A936ZTA0_9BURK|nr:MFS transporter [Ramlibacter aurantiacus]MBL0423301.1 MFS transporter [Ramlibacter aurantiacus]